MNFQYFSLDYAQYHVESKTVQTNDTKIHRAEQTVRTHKLICNSEFLRRQQFTKTIDFY